MSLRFTKLMLSGLVASVLAACGGGSSAPQTTPPAVVTPPTPSAPIVYRTLDSNAAQTSVLGGTGLQSTRSSGGLAVITTSGTLRHNTGATTVTAGDITLVDSNGANAAGVLIGANATITPDPGALGTDYQFAAGYRLSSTQTGTAVDITGIGGVATRAADIPGRGGASYVGGAQGFIIQGDSSTTLNTGRVIVSANFQTDRVTVTADQFEAVNDRTGSGTIAPIDTITASDLRISGNGFSGNGLTTSNNGATVNLSGGRTNSLASGTFFGLNTTTNEPAEVGGTLLIQGEDATIGATFLAD